MNNTDTQVKVIPATRDRFTARPNTQCQRRRVAAYARVSTDSFEQLTSYAAQIDYYTKYITKHNGWEFVEVYTDEGITGTSTKRREGFKRMIADALGGKIDLIITKSVSRFARNTVDSLSTIRQLKEKGVECYFEKENIWTFDGKGELLLTLMSSLAQEESRSNSENCIWGKRKCMRDGKVYIAYSNFLGYDRGPGGKLVINPEQAETVRRIFSLFLQGNTCRSIAKRLTAEGIKTPMGYDKWTSERIISILRNEKYKGDALLQKRFLDGYLTKKPIKNTGQLPQYYVSGNHEAIIEPDVFDMVQREYKRRTSGDTHYGSVHAFTSTVFCSVCGAKYGSRIKPLKTVPRQLYWTCAHTACDCRKQWIRDEDMQRIFISALNKLLLIRSEIESEYTSSQKTVYDTESLNTELQRVQDELQTTAESLNRLQTGSKSSQPRIAGSAVHAELNRKYSELLSACRTLEDEISEKTAARVANDLFFAELKKLPETVSEFDPVVYRSLVDRMIIYSKDRVTVRFKNGTEIDSQ